jgi:hypothetical protein
MAIEKEPSSYEKTVLSELQGARQNLRDEVAEQAGFLGWERALFHIDEAMFRSDGISLFRNGADQGVRSTSNKRNRDPETITFV